MADKIATRKAYGHALAELGEINKDIVVLDADLSESTYSHEFGTKFPDRFFDMGIAEQNMMGAAAGLALSGKTVFASTFAMFATGRAYEIIRNTIAYTGANVKICASHGGLSVGEDGASHQSIEDIALMRVIPGMMVFAPSDYNSCKSLIRQLAGIKGPAYVQLGRPPVPQIYGEDVEVIIGKAITARPGKDLTIIGCGGRVHAAIEAAEELEKEGISVRVLDMHTIKPIDSDAIVKAAEETGKILTVEEQSVIGGLGSAVAEVLAEKASNCRFKRIGIEDKFGTSGAPDELLALYGLDKNAIVSAVREMMK